MIDRTALVGRRCVQLAVLLLATTLAGAQEVPFRVFAVLPAVNQTGEPKVGTWRLTWQYVIQERIRELNGVQVSRLQDVPELYDRLVTGKLDPTTIAARNEVAQKLNAHLLIAPTMLKVGETFELKADLIDPAAGPKPVAEIASVSGTLPTVVADQIVVACLKAALNVPDVPLPVLGTDAIPATELQVLGASLYQWPYSGKANAQLGSLEKAEETLTRALRRQPHCWLLFQRYLAVMTASGKAAEALPIIQRWATTFTGTQARANLLLGEALVAAGKDLDATKPLAEAARLSKGAIPPVVALADAFRRIGKIDVALAQYETASAMLPNVRLFKLERGRLALELHKPDIAVKAFQAAIALAPKEPDAYFGMIRALVELNRAGDALTVAQQLVALRPDDLDAQQLLAKSALAAEKLDLARAAIDKVVAGRANDAKAQALLASVALAQADYATAEKAAAAAVKLDPKAFASYRDLAQARVYAEKPNYPGAVEAQQAAIKVAPDVERPALWLELAQIYLYAQRFGEGVKATQQAATLVPKDAEPRYLEGQIQLYAGKPEEAVAAYAAALELDPGAQGAGQRQIAFLEGEEKGGRSFDYLKLALGYLYQAQGRKAEARRKYNEFLTSNSAAKMAAWVRGQMAQLGGG